MAFIAIYTVGKLKHPYEHPASREFFEMGYDVIRQAAKSGHLIEEFPPYGVTFPEGAIKGEGSPIRTLTVWKSLQSNSRGHCIGSGKSAPLLLFNKSNSRDFHILINLEKWIAFKKRSRYFNYIPSHSL